MAMIDFSSISGFKIYFKIIIIILMVFVAGVKIYGYVKPHMKRGDPL